MPKKIKELKKNTSKNSKDNDYLIYKVPEVWLFKSDRVTVYSLQNDRYIVNNRSCYFPDFDILQLIADCFEVGSKAIALIRLRYFWENRLADGSSSHWN